MSEKLGFNPIIARNLFLFFVCVEEKIKFEMTGVEDGRVIANEDDNKVISCVAVGMYFHLLREFQG